MYTNHEKYALVNGVMLDGTRDMTPRTGLAVCVDGDRIAAVCDAADVPEGYARVDLGGKYLLPGLINLHVHLPASGKPRKKPSDPKKLVKLITSNGLMRRIGVKMCEGYARTELLSGVTTIRTVGGVADFDTIIRDLAAQGKLLRVVASNMAVSVPGGHMAGSLAYEARTPEEAAAFVEKIAAEKPDLIKLMITGGVMDAEVVGEPGVLRMQPALVKAACDKAHALGMQVAAHVESPEGVRVALENGVDSIEHGAKPDEHIMQLCKERGAFQVSTISPAVPYALFDRSISHATYEQQENGKVVFEGAGHRHRRPLYHPLRYVAGAMLLCEVLRRDAGVCAAQRHAGQCGAGGYCRRDRLHPAGQVRGYDRLRGGPAGRSDRPADDGYGHQVRLSCGTSPSEENGQCGTGAGQVPVNTVYPPGGAGGIFIRLLALQAQLVEGYGSRGSYIQAVHPMGHGDHHRVVALGDGAVGQPVALGAQHHRQPLR